MNSEDTESEYESNGQSSLSDLIERNKKDKGGKNTLTSCSLNTITCEDILFALFDESLRKIEPIIFRFYTQEAETLTQLSMNLSHNEQLDYVRRVHMASKMLVYLEMDLTLKSTFYQQVNNY